MAWFRSKDIAEVNRFVRSLKERGFTQAPIPTTPNRSLKPDTFRVYRQRIHKKPSKWIIVSYYEPRREPFKAVPTFGPPQPRGQVVYCKSESHARRRAYARHLCFRCYHRASYWANQELRDRQRERCAKRRAKAAQETVQKTVTSDPLTISTEGSNIPLVDSGT